ncbi:MAG TPA: DMT family transporter [Acidimicrobiia bacterium]|nr:DMT family transporter [Acidimicrobiia bacterium]
MSGRVALTIVLAVIAAFLDALSNVLEIAEAEQISEDLSLTPRLVTTLARRRKWIIGFFCDAGGFFAMAGALALGSVAFVQPILALALLMSMFLGSLLQKRMVRRVEWVSAAVLCGSLAAFLYEVPPRGGRDLVPFARWVVAGPAIAGAIVLCVAFSKIVRGPAQSLLLGVGASIAFATSAVLVKAFMHYLADGILAWAPHWEPYAMGAVIIAGFVIMQSSFQTGHLAASVAGLQAPGPVVAVILGAKLLDETVTVDTAFQSFVVVVSLVAIVLSILLLARAETLSSKQRPPEVAT